MGSDTLVLIASLALWPAGFYLLGRGRWPNAPLDAAPSVSIIIPARNEAHNLPALLHSISTQAPAPLEILVVDDASTDDTARIAAELGATVIASQPLPEGWRGKTWACHQGAGTARAEFLLFLDADTWLEPGGFARILAARGGGAASICPYHAVQKPYEQLSAFFNLVMVAGTLPRGLFGQMLLVDRAGYQASGGHEAVKGHILENVFMAAQFRRAGIPRSSRLGQGVLNFRMYPAGLIDLVHGWTKGFATGAYQTPVLRLLLITAWLIGMTLPLNLFHVSPWAAGVYLLYVLELFILLRRVGAFKWYTALLYPLPLLFYFAVFTWSLLRMGGNVTWKGRTIHAR